ncbi:MAG: tetratricopeptide repeat protein, partial [Acidipila sp.]|nr:tetratricopeptide repeat protein [Acidipila sp.]
FAALDGYEKNEQPLKSYYPRLLAGLDFDREAKRLANVQFAALTPDATAAAERQVAAPPPAEPSELERMLAEAKKQGDAQDPAAVLAYERIIQKYPDAPAAQYGLARALVIKGDVDRAKTMLQKVIQELSAEGAAAGADPQTLSWSHIWLARIYDVQERRDLAVPEYRAAMGVDGAPQSARSAAQKGLEKP